MEEQTIPNICRTCLSEKGEFKSIFQSADDIGLEINLAEMISAFSSIQVTFGDGLPEQICANCLIKAVNSYLFKVQCEKSDIVLRERLYLEKSTSEDLELVNDKFENFVEIKDEHFDLVNLEGTSQELLEKEERDKKFKCDICEKLFSTQNALSRHKNVHAFKICQKIKTENDSTEEEDIKKENEDANIISTCIKCLAHFLNQDDFEKHQQMHLIDGNKFVCQYCCKGFKKRSHLTRHVQIHLRAKNHVCETCNKSFDRLEQLNSHKNKHLGLKPYVCTFCSKSFNQSSTLKDHIRTHNGERPYLCPTCGKSFNSSGNLRQHLIRHTGIKAHLCSTCGSGFASKGGLVKHLRKHTGARPFVCDVCNKSFTVSYSLKKHKRIHTGERPYECDICLKKFSTSGHLVRHKRTHTGEKPYICQHCSKAFAQSNELTSHLRIHTGEKPYICDECGHAFRQSTTLRTHKKVHNKCQEKTIVLKYSD